MSNAAVRSSMTIIARRVSFFLETPATMLAAIIDSTVHVKFFWAESHVEQAGNGCVSVFCAAGVFPVFQPQGTVDWAPVLAEVVVLTRF